MKSLLIIVILIVFSGSTTRAQTGWHRLQPVISSDTEAVVVNFTGDCIFTHHFETHVGEDISSVFEGVPWFKRSDINMINLEHPITLHDEAEEKEFIFRMHPKYVRLLHKGNISLVNAANNHIYDFGTVGIEDTMEFLDSANIAYVGIGKTLQEAREPVIFTVKDKRLGFLGYFGGKGQYAATDTSAGLAPRFTSFILSDIAKLRPKVDYIIVSYHWGIENERYPEEWQIDLGRASVDAGADLVVGHHPHVVQGIDVYNGGVIAYSLGNFIFGGNRRTVHDTIVLQVLFGDEMIVRPIPVRIDNWRVAELEDDLSRAVIDTLHVYSHDFGNCFFEEYQIYGEK